MAPTTLVLSFLLLEKFFRKPFAFTLGFVFIVYSLFHGALIDRNIFLVEMQFCPNSSLYIYGFSLAAFLIPRSYKSVYYGKLRGVEVVLKEIGHGFTCSAALTEFQCVDLFGERLDRFTGEMRNVLLCPTVQGIENLFSSNARNDLRHIANEYFAEPLLLQLLRAEDGWPVPKYFGRCDQSIIVEYDGPILSHTDLNSWSTRVKIAANLLRLADTFTFQHANFSFYFTDISPDNVAVKPDLTVSIIDLDNVIIVDRREKFVPDDIKIEWSHLHESKTFEEDVFTFSSLDICRHQYSDHNFFAVCGFILARSDILNHGLLEDIPNEELSKLPQLPLYLQECVKPQHLANRFEAGRELMKLLELEVS